MTTPAFDPSPSLVSQAQTILEAATSLQQQLESASLPQPSSSPTGRRDWHDVSQLPSLFETRFKLLDAVQSMLDLAAGPLDTLLQHTALASTKIEVLCTLDDLKIAEHVPVEGDIGFVELADKLELNRDLLDRHLRCRYMMNIFRESKEGYVAHTGISTARRNYQDHTRRIHYPRCQQGRRNTSNFGGVHSIAAASEVFPVLLCPEFAEGQALATKSNLPCEIRLPEVVPNCMQMALKVINSKSTGGSAQILK